MKRREHVFVRMDVIERYLADLARFHADAGRPAHVAGVRSAMAKIKREVARSDKPCVIPGVKQGNSGPFIGAL